jgi:hypothetical protein
MYAICYDLIFLMWRVYSIFFLFGSGAAFPIGVNLSPLGGKDLGGVDYASVNWNSVSTNVFVDIYKHCSPLYLRSVSISSSKNGNHVLNYDC